MFVQLTTSSCDSAVVPPIVPPKTIFPAPAVKLRVLAPLIVLEKVMLPAPAPVESVVVAVRETAPANDIAVFTVVTVPERFTAPPPLSAKVPVMEPPPPVNVSAPELTIATFPKEVVLREPLIAKAAPVRWMPPEPADKLPSVVVPEPPVSVMDAAVMLPAVTFCGLVIVRAPIGVVPPTALLKRRFPAPLKTSVSVCVPLTVFENVISLPLLDVSRWVKLLNATADANEIGAAAVTLPASVTAPVPVCAKAPVREVPPINVRAAELLINRGPPFEVVTTPSNSN